MSTYLVGVLFKRHHRIFVFIVAVLVLYGHAVVVNGVQTAYDDDDDDGYMTTT